MPVESDLYDLLGVSTIASEGEEHSLQAMLSFSVCCMISGEIKKAYRTKVVICTFHPQIGSDFNLYTGEGSPPGMHQRFPSYLMLYSDVCKVL